MDIFAKILQGPYAYLLVLQVLIVSGLCLTLIYLILLRLREVPMTHTPARLAAVPTIVEKPPEPLVVPPQAPVPVPVPPPPATTIEALPDLEMPDPFGIATPPPDFQVAPSGVDPQVLAAEKERARALEQEAATTKEKVRFLESKLLEYEILQEEIGALSSLKVENEKLRQDLMAARRAQPAPTPVPEAVPEIPVPPQVQQASNTASALLSEETEKAEVFDSRPGVAIADNPVVRSQVDSIISEVEVITKTE